MFDNLTIIPEGTPEAVASVVNNLIDKISMFCGWAVQPRGKRKDREEAFEYMKDAIMNNPNMPEYLKAIEIANVRKLFKEYENRNDVVNIALEDFLNNSSDRFVNMQDVTEDWLDYFMDRVRLVNDERLKIIWGKILAEEVRNGGISKKLLHILSIISAEDAMNFNRICSYYVEFENIDEGIGHIQVFDFKEIPLNIAIRLNSIGLINALISEIESYSSTITFDEEEERAIICNYRGERAKISVPDGKILLGKINLTQEGEILQKLIVSEKKQNMLEYIFKQYPESEIEIL